MEKLTTGSIRPLCFVFLVLAMFVAWATDATATPSATPSTSPNPCVGLLAQPLARAELDAIYGVRSTLFDTGRRPPTIGDLARGNRAALCELYVNEASLDTNYQTRRTAAADPTLIRARYPVSNNLACPFMKTYAELNYTTGTVGEAVTYWRENYADLLDEASAFGVAAWARPSDGPEEVGLLVTVVRIVNRRTHCPPDVLPEWYVKRHTDGNDDEDEVEENAEETASE
ncbi:uncharacterized protein ACA1_270490 [Acanthamoeba castellanii str. Neff]|uniref:SCP domain-containing protein n=1 Tax=Acanthamoeba castellanii (strain ATCC 30010 / Neff) TaxID=1257118 RepID=L8H261_ACACF|nr:uncharacterized protein ACA1_270490 [Acanthamoeba castellanii str. Neff]ELR19564.1 hypothetical protein ACA1_270490 [Acanthamoeba castellanii str. Neff]